MIKKSPISKPQSVCDTEIHFKKLSVNSGIWIAIN